MPTMRLWGMKTSTRHPARRLATAAWTHHLLRSHTNGLDAELAPTHVKEVFEVGAEQVDDEDIVQTLLTEVVDLGDTGWMRCRMRTRAPRSMRKAETRTGTVERSVRPVLVSQLRSFGLARFLGTREINICTTELARPCNVQT